MRPARLSLLALAVATSLACAGNLDAGPGPGPGSDGVDGGSPGDDPGQTAAIENIWLVGDSLAVGAEPHVRTLLDPSLAVIVHAKEGALIENRLPFLYQAGAAADAVVVQAGINNVGGGFIDESGLEASVASAMDATADAPCVVWTTYLTSYPDGAYTALGEAKPELGGQSVSQRLNQILREQAAARDNVHVAEFQPLIDAQRDAWVAADGLHLNQTGYQNLAATYADTLVEDCGATR